MSRIRERARRQLIRYSAGTNVEQFIRGLHEHAVGSDIDRVERLEEQAQRIMAGLPENSVTSTGGMRIDPHALYPRQALLAMGMPRRLVNSLASSRVQRGQYMGSAVIAALESRTKAIKHPVDFKAGRQHNGRR